MGDRPKVEFVLGSEVSPGHFFKSSFARSFVTNCRDSKSLDYEFLDNGTIAEEPENSGRFTNCRNNNDFFSLVNFASTSEDLPFWSYSENSQTDRYVSELDRLRKQCQELTAENQRLQSRLTNHVPEQTIDNVFLQGQVDALQWQLKQAEANRQMYRSMMEQVVRFLDRARKSLDILHDKSCAKNKGSRVPRSRSVHGVHMMDPSPSRAASAASSSSSGSSRFTRAKSVTQIAQNSSSSSSSGSPCGLREFTWSILRRNEPVHSTPPRAKKAFKQQDFNKTHDGVFADGYRSPKNPELIPDDVPPERLAQEAFRLMRTVQSLLSTREPVLMRAGSPEDNVSSPSPVNPRDTSLLDPPYANSTGIQEPSGSSSDRGTESSSTTDEDRVFKNSPASSVEVGSGHFQQLLSGTRLSLDATSLNSGSSKTTEDEEIIAPSTTCNSSTSLNNNNSNSISYPNLPTKQQFFTRMPNRRPKKAPLPKPTSTTASVSSAEDESGFSSMSSFQEVGLPPTTSSPMKGCHTEVGLPEVPLDKVRHRRWSSTPAEFQAMFKRYSGNFSVSQQASESLSVWV